MSTKNIEEYNLGRKIDVLIVFGDKITDMIINKNLIEDAAKNETKAIEDSR